MVEKIKCLRLDFIRVYRKSDGYTDKYIAYVFSWNGSSYSRLKKAFITNSIEEMRELIPDYKIRLKNSIHDDSTVLETWL